MFHVEPTVRALVLGAFLSLAALGQTDAGQTPPAAAGTAENIAPLATQARATGADAGSGAAQQPPAKKKRRSPKTAAATSGFASDKASSKRGSSATGKGGGGTKTAKRDPRTVGIGRSCGKRADCASAAQVCVRQRDQRGKTLPRGVCLLPCVALEHGLTKTRPGFPARDPQTTERILKVPPPPRCPANYQCRSKGGDVPIDMCVKG